VLAHELGHLEHVDLLLAAEDGLELVVSVDVATVLLILQLVLLDVRPQLAGDFSALELLVRAENGGQLADGVTGGISGGLRFEAGFFAAVFLAAMFVVSSPQGDVVGSMRENRAHEVARATRENSPSFTFFEGESRACAYSSPVRTASWARGWRRFSRSGSTTFGAW
jgi:hypothetical protein